MLKKMKRYLLYILVINTPLAAQVSLPESDKWEDIKYLWEIKFWRPPIEYIGGTIEGRLGWIKDCDYELKGYEGYARLWVGDAIVAQTSIDQNGHFTFTKIPEGTYHLVYEWSGIFGTCWIWGDDTFYFDGTAKSITYCEPIYCP